MHKTRPHTRPAARKMLKVICECIRERAGRHAGRRMDHEPSRFVYHDERVVFVNNINRNILRYERLRRGRDQLNFDFIMFPNFVRRFRRLAVNEYVFILDQALETCSTPTLDL